MTFTQTLLAAWRAWFSPKYEGGAPPPWWATLIVTLLWNTAWGLFFTALGWMYARGRFDLWGLLFTTQVISHAVGFSIGALMSTVPRWVGHARIDGWSGKQRGWFFASLSLLGIVIGFPLGAALIGLIQGRVIDGLFGARFWVYVLVIWAVVSLVFAVLQAHRARLLEAETRLAADRARAAELERRAVDAQLRALQAQIEPHFLFNTLATVVSLIDTQPADARRMLERLIDLLRASLSASRAQQATLGHEIDLLRAYLDILTIRMAGRLQVDIDVPASLRGLPLAPMLLQPLVENAIQHGLEPKVEGGRVRVAARCAERALALTVEDDGAGFGALTRGGGVGLSNLRERLAALYGGAAALSIEDAHPGTRVRITLPMTEAAPAAAPPPLAATAAPMVSPAP